MDASASTKFRNNLTFSSTLLDEIYRSIDEQTTVNNETTRKKQSKPVASDSGKSRNRCFNNNNNDDRRACLYQKLMQNKASEKLVTGSSMTCKRESFRINSSPSSCDFSCHRGGGCSLSETEWSYGVVVKPKPKPISTSVCQQNESIVKVKHEGKFVKTKSKALKIYNDLKQPISPGGRLSTFINSIFTTGNNKKSNTSGDHTEAVRSHLHRKSTSGNASTCSSTSSISRSCLTNTPSSRGKLINDMKRSVRFNPVSSIIDEETQSTRNNRHAARNLLKNYQNKVECEFDSVTKNEGEDENQWNDWRSDSSSDLFELNNLSPIRIRSHQEELPLYATTHINNNNNLFM